jgi:hypothetical protein
VKRSLLGGIGLRILAQAVPNPIPTVVIDGKHYTIASNGCVVRVPAP